MKTKLASLIASKKRDLPGHQLRHDAVNYVRGNELDVEVMGRGYVTLDKKEDGLAPFCYSVVIENCQEASYASEKLIDALLCRAVPLYWGAAGISQYFDMGGIIVCDDKGALEKALRKLSREDYERRAAAVEENYHRAVIYSDSFLRAAVILRDEG